MLAVSIIQRSDCPGFVTGAVEGGAKGGDIAFQTLMVIPTVVIVRVFSCPHAGTRRVANWTVGVGMVKGYPFMGQGVQVWSCIFHRGVAHAPHLSTIHAFGVDEKDVGTVQIDLF